MEILSRIMNNKQANSSSIFIIEILWVLVQSTLIAKTNLRREWVQQIVTKYYRRNQCLDFWWSHIKEMMKMKPKYEKNNKTLGCWYMQNLFISLCLKEINYCFQVLKLLGPLHFGTLYFAFDFKSFVNCDEIWSFGEKIDKLWTDDNACWESSFTIGGFLIILICFLLVVWASWCKYFHVFSSLPILSCQSTCIWVVLIYMLSWKCQQHHLISERKDISGVVSLRVCKNQLKRHFSELWSGIFVVMKEEVHMSMQNITWYFWPGIALLLLSFIILLGTIDFLIMRWILWTDSNVVLLCWVSWCGVFFIDDDSWGFRMSWHGNTQEPLSCRDLFGQYVYFEGWFALVMLAYCKWKSSFGGSYCSDVNGTLTSNLIVVTVFFDYDQKRMTLLALNHSSYYFQRMLMIQSI